MICPPEYENETTNRRTIEVRGFKWPQRPIAVAVTTLLGEDAFGRWLGIRQGDPWWTADHVSRGVFEHSFVKLIPTDTFWTACFHAVGHIVDVDIVLPVRWVDDVVEEVDLELDILRSADGVVSVRDQDTFAQVRAQWDMPSEIAGQAETTCAQIRTQVERGVEPFGTVGPAWLARFLADVEARRA